MEEKRFSEQVKEKIKPDNVEITIKFPRLVLNKFTEYAKKEAANCYWLAIEKLLTFKQEQTELDMYVKMLMERDDVLAMQLTELKEEISKIGAEAKKPKTRKTFGRKEEGDMK